MNQQRIRFQDAIARAPQAVGNGSQSVAAALRGVDPAPFRRGTVGLVGIGASLHAVETAAAYLQGLGHPAFLLEADRLFDTGHDPCDAYVAVSASGRSVEPNRAMAARPAGTPSLGVAVDAASPLSGVVRYMVPTGTGADSSPNTTSYIGALQALGMLADHVACGPDGRWSGLPAALGALLASLAADGRADEAGRALGSCAFVDCVGAGTARGTAGYAALLLREAARIPAQSWNTLHYLHGPMEPQDIRSGLLVLGDGREVALAREMASYGVTVVLVTAAPVAGAANLSVLRNAPAGHPMAEAVLQSVLCQTLVGAAAARRGFDECRFRYRQADTKVDAG